MARGFDLQPLDGKTFGAVVTGVKLATVDDATLAELRKDWVEYGLLIFPGQFLSNEQQIAFAKRLGPLEFEMAALSNVKADGSLRREEDNDDRMKVLKGNMGWHHDSTYMPLQAKGAVFTAETVPSNGAPTGFADTLDPKNGNKLGIIDIQRQYNMVAAALASGGSVSNFEPGKARLIEGRKAGARIYPSNEAFAQALKTGEIACGIMWKARAVQWQNAGIKVQTVAPKEGVPMYVSGFVMPKNAPNKEGAYAWLDAMMAASAQENFAIDMGYNPTVTNAKVADDLQKRIGFTPEEQKRLVDLDYGYMGKNDVDFQDWWNKSFKG